MKPVSYDVLALPDVPVEQQTIPEDWHEEASSDSLIAPSTTDVLIAMETAALAQACLEGRITKQQFMEYLQS